MPKRIGDPSTIKHVFLLVKENRTYDQVQGDMRDADLPRVGVAVFVVLIRRVGGGHGLRV